MLNYPVTLKMGSRSPKPYEVLKLFQRYIGAKLADLMLSRADLNHRQTDQWRGNEKPVSHHVKAGETNVT